MSGAEYESVRLQDILKEESIEVHFQPIISIQDKAVVAFEGFSRGVEMPTGRLIPPTVLLKKASEEELTSELDALFRKKVFQSFSEQFRREPRMILTVNLETSLVGLAGDSALDPDVFARLAGKYQIDPARVAIEIVESHTSNTHLLERFIEIQKQHGFLIALDDVGSGHSNLDRVARLKPDIIKIDRSLIIEVQKEYYKQEVFRSLVGLSRQIGALVVAEGMEQVDEAVWALELGADLLQGYYFARPQNMIGGFHDHVEKLIDDVGQRFRSLQVGHIHDMRKRAHRIDSLLLSLQKEIVKARPKDFDDRLIKMLKKHTDLEALYVLDEAGMQVTRTYCSAERIPQNMKSFCKPMDRGSDHSLRDHYFRLALGDPTVRSYATEPYILLTTGRLSVTLSTFFKDEYGHGYILCVDLVPEKV